MNSLGKSLLIIAVLGMIGCGKPASVSKDAKPTPMPDDPRAIKVGLFLPLSGIQSAFGEATLNGAKLAVDEINAAGGVLGRPLRLLVEDTRSEGSVAAEAVRKLLAEKVVALIGEVTSERTLEAAAIAGPTGIPMITPGATNEAVTRAAPSIFRVCYADPFPGKVMSKFAISIGAARGAVLCDPSDPYSAGLADSFSKDFLEQGGEIVASETYKPGTVDFTAQLLAIKNKQPEIIFLPSYFPEAARIIKQARAQGIDAPFLGTDGWESEEFLKAGGAEVNNSYFSSHFSADEKSERTQAFVAAYQKAFGRPPVALSALGYDSVRFLADGITRAGDTAPAGLSEALAKTADFPAVTGKFSLDGERNPVKSVIVLRVAEGKFNYLETVSP